MHQDQTITDYIIMMIILQTKVTGCMVNTHAVSAELSMEASPQGQTMKPDHIYLSLLGICRY